MAFNPPFVDDEIPSSAKWNQAGGAYERSTSSVDIVSSVALTDLYSKTIMGGHLSSDRTLHVVLLGDYLNNSGGTSDLTLQVDFGGTTLWKDTDTLVAGANRVPLLIGLFIKNLGVTNSQVMRGSVLMGYPGAGAPAVGIGKFDQSSMHAAPIGGSAAEDTTIDRTLVIKAQHSVSSASVSVRKLAVDLMLW